MVLKSDAVPTLHSGVIPSDDVGRLDEVKKTKKENKLVKKKKTKKETVIHGIVDWKKEKKTKTKKGIKKEKKKKTEKETVHGIVASEEETKTKKEMNAIMEVMEKESENETKTKSCYFISDKCVIGGCTSSEEGNSNNIRLRRLTKDTTIRNKWIKFIKSTRDDSEQLCFLTSRRHLHKYLVCSWHFTPDQYMENNVKLFKFKINPNYPRLKGNAVPHVRKATNPFPDEFFADHLPQQCIPSESPSPILQGLLDPKLSISKKLERMNSVEASCKDSNDLPPSTSELESSETIHVSISLYKDPNNSVLTPSPELKWNETIHTSALEDSVLSETVPTSELKESANDLATSTIYKMELMETEPTCALKDSTNDPAQATTHGMESAESEIVSASNESAIDPTDAATYFGKELTETIRTSSPEDMSDTTSSTDMIDSSPEVCPTPTSQLEEIFTDSTTCYDFSESSLLNSNDTSRQPRIVQPCAANSACAEFFVQPEGPSANHSDLKLTNHQNQIGQSVKTKSINVALDVFKRLNQLKAEIGMRSFSDVVKELLDSYEEDYEMEDHDTCEEGFVKDEEGHESDDQDHNENEEQFATDEDCERYTEDTCIFTLKNELSLKDEEGLRLQDQSPLDTGEMTSSHINLTSDQGTMCNANQVESQSKVTSSLVFSAESSQQILESPSKLVTSVLALKENDHPESKLQKPPSETSPIQIIDERETRNEELDDKDDDIPQEDDEDLMDLFQEDEEEEEELDCEREDVCREVIEDLIDLIEQKEDEDNYNWEDDKNDENYDPSFEDDYGAEPSSDSDWDSDEENYNPPKKRKKPNPNKIKKIKSVDVILQAYPLKLKCKLCQEILADEACMKQHIVDNHGNQETLMPKKHKDYAVKAKLLGKVDASETVSDLEVSVLSSRIRLCTTCQEYVPELNMKKHLIKHIPLNYTCEKCGVKLKNYSTSHVCLDKRKPKKKLNYNKKWPSSSKPVQCDRCGQKYSNKYRYKIHLRTHLSVKPFQCPECDKGFCQKSNLNIHMRIHSGDKPYQCDLCSEAYAHKVSLKSHKKKTHGVDMWAKEPDQVT